MAGGFICDLKRGTHERRAFTGNGGNILNMHRDGSNYWMGTANGAVLYDLQNDKKLSAVLKDYQITGVVKDIEDNYWFTSYGGGIFFCTSLEMFSYTSQDGLISDQVTCLNKKQNGEIWLGFGMDGSKPGAYVSYIHHNKIHPVRLTNQPSFDRLITKQITFYENRKWITTTHGVFCLEENRHIVAFSYGRCLLEYPENMIWYGSGGSVFKNNRADYVRLGKNALSPEANQTGMFTIGLVSLNKYMMKPKALYADLYGRVWAGAKEGLFQLQDTALIKVSPENSGVHAPVNDFVEMPDSTLVMATDGDGIVINKNNRWVMTINEDNGLSTNICKAVAIDPDGVLWVATHRGLNKISGYPDNVTVEYLTIFDGILSNDVSDVLIHDDTVWVATNKGLNFFHRKHVQRKTNSPRVYIDRITVKGVPVKINNDGDEISLKYSENDIGIKYTGLLFSNGEPLLYRYKLHREDPWRFTKNTTVYLPELIAGDYEFIVSAKGLAGQWSQEASLTFSIKKPFWKTGLFIAAVIFITLGIIGWIANIYIDQQRKEMQRQHRVTLSELRSLRAQMNPHFLFNALNSIQGVLLKNNIETTQDYLGRFGKLMRLILDHSDKTTITIREELESITNYLEIEQLRAGHQFEYRIDIDPELSIESAEIPAMILQPFIENAIWHGFGHKRDGSDLLVIRFGMRNNDIIITITDNGIGRKRALALRKPNHKSKGLQLVKERIDILNYNNSRKIELKIEDLEDEHGNHPGTHVIIKIPSIY
jgi:two-component sensor histidine kinase